MSTVVSCILPGAFYTRYYYRQFILLYQSQHPNPNPLTILQKLGPISLINPEFGIGLMLGLFHENADDHTHSHTGVGGEHCLHAFTIYSTALIYSLLKCTKASAHYTGMMGRAFIAFMQGVCNTDMHTCSFHTTRWRSMIPCTNLCSYW